MISRSERQPLLLIAMVCLDSTTQIIFKALQLLA
jgi:hypothetical protein